MVNIIIEEDWMYRDILSWVGRLRKWEVSNVGEYYSDDSLHILSFTLTHKVTKVQKDFNIYFTQELTEICNHPRPHYHYYFVEMWQQYVSTPDGANYVDVHRERWEPDEEGVIDYIKHLLRVYWDR